MSIVAIMYSQIITLLKYLLENRIKDCTDKKHIVIHLIEDSEKSAGTVQIDAVGSWIQEFHIRKFKATTWNNCTTELTVHHGNNNVHNYYVYKISKGCINLELQFEPYLKECDQYLSFVLSARKQELHNIHPKLKKYVRTLVGRYREVKISLSVSESLWKVVDTTEKSARLIADALSNMIRYSAGLDFQTRALELLQAEGSLNVADNMYNRLNMTGGANSTTTGTLTSEENIE